MSPEGGPVAVRHGAAVGQSPVGFGVSDRASEARVERGVVEDELADMLEVTPTLLAYGIHVDTQHAVAPLAHVPQCVRLIFVRPDHAVDVR